MNKAKVSIQKMTIPTYGVGKEDKNPMFFEKRVYQGSSGKVYPNPVIEKIYDEKKDVEYNAVILENDWLYVVVLPELGGRIYTAYDKTNNYDFVYHNKVIKPALVGLLGPWISGGIEFNWPQHHRPSTYMPVNYKTEEYPDGSVAVFVGETEKMFSLEQTTQIKLYPDKSYIEINTNVYNRSPLTQTFLWWANPAYRVNDDTRTIMPPDVSAVMDHGKRAVSTFPIATGEYYKMDYSKGVDISRYKNLPVPTSFMAYKSNFDFVGGYDDGRKAGLLHVADHHVSPGKKQWTWGSGDFGIAWDRNLTDEDGPYVELMTGCFTDNQPDFTFIQPQENKSFTQYFMPYHEVGEIKNANKDFCLGYENNVLTIYSSVFAKADIEVVDGKSTKTFQAEFAPTEAKTFGDISQQAVVKITYDNGVLKFSPDMVEKFEIPDPATACPEPCDCKTQEELYMYGLHIEQYRHATRLPEDYYLEGLKRDDSDYRLNYAYGNLMLRRGRFDIALKYLQKAVDKSIIKNPNPINTEAHFACGMAHFYLGEYDKAYDMIYKCVWSNECKTQAFYMLSVLSYLKGEYNKACEFADKSIAFNNYNIKAYNLKGNILNKLGDSEGARKAFEEANKFDVLDKYSLYELSLLNNDKKDVLKGVSAHEIITYSTDLLFVGEYAKAQALLECWTKQNCDEPMVCFYTAYAKIMAGAKAEDTISKAVELAHSGVIHFSINLYDILVLKKIAQICDNDIVNYYLGNLYYDKKQYDLACEYWEKAQRLNDTFPTVKRNLALYYFNKKHDSDKAVDLLTKAYQLDKTDSRILMELYTLYGVVGKSRKECFELLEQNYDTMIDRDDLYIEYIGHIADRDMNKAYQLIMNRKFHPWEGGEGKVTKLYKRIVCGIASQTEDYDKAIEWYKKAFSFPHNLGEGKLILDYDNDVWYMMGELAAKHGKSEAKEYYQMATRGNATVADDMYYNDNPIEYIYYMALANLRLGNVTAAQKIKQAFIGYSDKHIGKHTKIDYFAVSLPDLLVWEQDLDKRNDNFCKYVKSLAENIK